MARGPSKTTAVVISGYLYTDDEYTGARLDTPEWLAWLALGVTFSIDGMTVRSEQRRKRPYWFGYRRVGGVLHKRYLGASERLTRVALEAAAAGL